MKEIKLELINLLKEFQDGYTKRDLSMIDTYMDKFFDKEDNIVIVGTGLGEWCLGYDEAKELVASDWEYWGDFNMNIDEADINVYGNVAFINTKGTLKYTFKHEAETYTRYLNSAKENIADESRSSKIKLTETNYILSHFLHQRDNLENQYLWNINVTFVLVKREEKWYIRQMQFSMPVDGHYPDARIVGENYFYGAYKGELDHIKTYSKNNSVKEVGEIRGILDSFIKDCVDKNKVVDTITGSLFGDNTTFVNTDQKYYKGLKKINSIIEEYRSNYDDIKLNTEDILINSHEDVIWIATDGIFEKRITEVEIFDKAKEEIDEISIREAIDDKEKLFKIRRTIADAVKENALGEDFVWPFRFEVIMIKKNGNWIFDYMQFSYPFDMILEGKTDAVS